MSAMAFVSTNKLTLLNWQAGLENRKLSDDTSPLSFPDQWRRNFRSVHYTHLNSVAFMGQRSQNNIMFTTRFPVKLANIVFSAKVSWNIKHCLFSRRHRLLGR